MANRSFTSQFSYSFEKQIVDLVGAFTESVAGVRASLVNQGVTYSAVAFGAAGNAVTIALVDPADVDQALVISVVGSAISASLATDSGGLITTTATDLVAALAASIPASALVTASGSGASPLTALVPTNLASGVDAVFTTNLPIAYMSLSQTAEGLYRISLSNKYLALLGVSITLQTASAKDLSAQLISEGVNSTALVDFRMIAGATPTSLAVGDVLYIELKLRNVG